MITTKRVEGEVDYNDGDFAEVKTIGIEGEEKELWLGTLQIHREDTQDTPREFRERFSVGTQLDIVVTTAITTKSNTAGDSDTSAPERGPSPHRLQ